MNEFREGTYTPLRGIRKENRKNMPIRRCRLMLTLSTGKRKLPDFIAGGKRMRNKEKSNFQRRMSVKHNASLF
jgi:hypothetical protein